VLLSPVEVGAFAFDPFTETAHQLNATAGMLLAACDGERDLDEAVTAWADVAGVERDVVAADVVAGMAALRELGLVGRDKPFVAPERPVGSVATPATSSRMGLVHPVIDYDIAFRSAESQLIEAIDVFLGTGSEGRKASMFFDVSTGPSGEVVLETDHEWRFPSRQAFFRQLTSVMNEYAVWTHSCAALHAGAVRSPSGEVVLLPAPSGAGKSTLTGAFVAAGWDYLGDEAIGVRPGPCAAVGYPKRLAIDAGSRTVLGLPGSDLGDLDPSELRPGVQRLTIEAGPITRVLLPAYGEGAQMALTPLAPHEAVVELLANTLNLARCGQPALDAVCDLAATVPVERLVHCDARKAVVQIEARRVGVNGWVETR